MPALGRALLLICDLGEMDCFASLAMTGSADSICSDTTLRARKAPGHGGGELEEIASEAGYTDWTTLRHLLRRRLARIVREVRAEMSS